MKHHGRSTGGGVSKIGDILPELMVRYGLHRRQNLEQIEEAWRQTVGEQYAAFTQIEKLQRGTLTIKVAHNALIQEFLFRHSELVDTLAALIEGEKIKQIRFVV
jgi:predicted nucleic acid-binding Zn ribbon protein